MKYTTITETQMNELLKSDKGWKQTTTAKTKELVYEFPLKQDGIVIKVYSSIARGQSRKKGTDAIRVCAVKGDKGWVKAPRVLRVEGWRDNLKTRVLDVITQAKARR
jgi:hypothetical protein